MNHQEMIETSFKGLWEQNCKSSDSTSCFYRGPNGTKCGVGWIIPDEYITENINKRKISFVIINKFPMPDYINEENRSFLICLQHTHDTITVNKLDGSFREQLKKAFKALGKEFKLNTNFMDVYKVAETF